MSKAGLYSFFCALSIMVMPNSAILHAAEPASPPQLNAGSPRLVLLGTSGGPVPSSTRSQPATALIVGGKTYLIDAGENFAQQLVRSRLTTTSLDAIFLTHLHFDHTLGLGPFMAYAWMTARTRPYPVYGPPGTNELVRRNLDALAPGIAIFQPQLPPRPAVGALFPAQDISATTPFLAYSDDVVRITSVANSHYGTVDFPARAYGVDRSLSYRFDTPNGSIVFTGDTGPSPDVEALAEGCDILVSEIVHLPSVTSSLARVYGSADDPRIAALRLHMEAEHLTPTEVGKLAQKSNAKKLVITHFVGAQADPDDIIKEIRRYYPKGTIVIGKDLMEIPLGRVNKKIQPQPKR